MSDELLAKTELRTPSFMGSRGGIPEITGVDVSAAMGMARDKFGAMMYLMAMKSNLVSIEDCDRELAARQFGEWRERAERLLDAQLRMAAASTANGLIRRIREREAKAIFDTARQNMWPRITNTYAGIRAAVFYEFREPKVCRQCNGRGHFMAEKLRVDCRRCGGSGRVYHSDASRAHICGVDRSNFSRLWSPVWEWTYKTVRDAISIGRAEFNEHIG